MEWKPVPLVDLGDLIGHAVKIVTAEGHYQGGLKAITASEVYIEVGEGQVVAVELSEILQEDTQLFKAE